MARAKRTHEQHRREYARAKELAKERGYRSQRARKADRAAVEARSMGYTSASEVRDLRRTARIWSDAHSRQSNSRYRPSMKAAQVYDYVQAYVMKGIEGRTGRDIHKYLVKYGLRRESQRDEDNY